MARDFEVRLPGYALDMVFDVGANTGQTIRRVRKCFAGHNPEIVSFEPVPATFKVLTRQHGEDPKVRLVNAAVGRAPGTGVMTAMDTNPNNRLTQKPGRLQPTVNVPIVAGAQYCADEGITAINLLKIDTEGSDLDVLLGFLPMLMARTIDFAQVEASTNSGNKRHSRLEDFLGLMRPLGYELFGLYDQAHEMDGRPLLRRVNPLFVSPEIVGQYRRVKPA